MDGVRVLRGPFESAPAAGDVVDRPAQEREDLAATLEARRRARAAVERGERAVSGEPPPVTWRALEAFAACPLQYRYGYLTGLRVEPAADAEAEHVRSGVADDRIDPASIPAGVDPAQFGRFVHEALRVAATRPDAPAPDITSPLLARFDFPPRRHAALEEAAAALVDAFRSSELARVGEDAGFEEPFQVRPRSAVFHGIFDRIERTPEGWRVVDYKVGVPDDVHARQVAFYAWALERIVGAPVVGDVAYIRASGVDARRVADRAEVEGVARTVASFEEAAGAGEFTATPGEACRSCPSRGVCPSALLDAAGDQR
jgi:ATP-dependent exoDNAse (exonuclease V) beta subunit